MKALKFDPIVKTLIDYGATDFDDNTESPEEVAFRRERAQEHDGNKFA